MLAVAAQSWRAAAVPVQLVRGWNNAPERAGFPSEPTAGGRTGAWADAHCAELSPLPEASVDKSSTRNCSLHEMYEDAL